MSLDVYLTGEVTKHTCASCAGKGAIEETDDIYTDNITHNLDVMAQEAGIYFALWRPEEIGIKKAYELIPLLTEGLDKLEADMGRFEKLNPKNGWGSYSGLREFVSKYLKACREHPNANVRASR